MGREITRAFFCLVCRVVPRRGAPRYASSGMPPLVERNHEVQTLSSYGPDQSLTECISLGRLWRSSQDPQSEPLYQFLIELRRENGVTVMDREAIRPPVREPFPKLLQRPFSRRVGGHIALQDTSRSEFEHHKHVEELEFGRDCNHEVTSDDRIGMIAHECRPVRGRSSRRSTGSTIIPLPGPVLSDCSR